MDLKTLKKLIAIAHKGGITKLKTPEIELEFSGIIPQKQSRSQKNKEVQEDLPEQYSDMDMLMWSVPQIDNQEAN